LGSIVECLQNVIPKSVWLYLLKRLIVNPDGNISARNFLFCGDFFVISAGFLYNFLVISA
jgi:hypothetical protein